MKLTQLFYLPWWYFQIKFLRKKKPLQTVLFISNHCNYACKHCCIDKTCKIEKSYAQIKSELEYSYKLGSRFVDFEGGEPTLWQDEDKNINDLCNLAKEIGFFTTTVTTNASQDFSYLNADHVFVSLDGIKNHDNIRCKGAFEKLKENIAKFPRRKDLSVNMVINSINQKEVKETLEFVEKSPFINGISFNFYNNFNGDSSLNITDKKEIIKELLEYKKRGFNIINTEKGLKYLANPNFEKVCWMTNFITVEGQKFIGCQGINSEICKDCGFGMAGEMRALFDFSLSTILAGLKLRK